MIQMTKPAIAGLMVFAALTACAKKDNAATDTTAAATAKADTTAPAATAAADTKWTPANIGAWTWAANNGEVQLGKLAETKATAADVKAFAKLMVTDHSAMLEESKALNATPDTTVGDVKDLNDHARDELKDLTDKAKGADWDKNYMDKMIDDHQKVLDKLQDAAKNTTDAALRTKLEAAVGKVQTHLTKAQDIKAKMK